MIFAETYRNNGEWNSVPSTRAAHHNFTRLNKENNHGWPDPFQRQ
jgi:hypothetical protein